MQVETLPYNTKAHRLNVMLESLVNHSVRAMDSSRERLGGVGRKAHYDDRNYEFRGGASDTLRKKHYDKSLRLLWKAEDHTPYLNFHDSSPVEKELMAMATRALTAEEKAARKRLSLPEYKDFLNSHYTREQKQAIVNILAAIGHGEAYAWLVSAELLGVVRSTGARAALTMQVLEEAKHFVVLRELLQAFDVDIPRQTAWEYLLLEGAYKAPGLDKFFGMNVVVEGIALSLFGVMSHLPGLEVLRLFHLDESRHTALPQNYFEEFPMSRWQMHSPASRMRRLRIVLPALMLVPLLERDLALLGVDAFDFGGSVLRKVVHLAKRNRFMLPIPHDQLLALLEQLFNVYCQVTREGHQYKRFMTTDTTMGEAEREVERQIFATA